MGDFNLPHVDWSYHHANSFLKFVNSYSLTIFVDEPNRESNILDLVLSTSDMSISDDDVFPPIDSSDHNAVMFNTNFVNSLNHHCASTPNFFDWSRANYAMISDDLCSVDRNHVFQHCFHGEDCWSMFTETLTRLVNEHVFVVHTSTNGDK